MKASEAVKVMIPKARQAQPAGLGGVMDGGAARSDGRTPKAPDPAKPGPVLGGVEAGATKPPGPKPDAGTRDGATFVALVRWASETAATLGAAERVKAGQGISATTEATYAATAARRLDLSAPGGGRLMEGVTAASWHATRSALAWAAAREWQTARRECDRCRRAKDDDGAWRAALRAAAAIEALGKIEAAEKPAPTGRRASKRATLPKAADWQATVFAAATPAQKPAVAVLWATGCRPVEIEKGVDVRRDSQGRLVVVIPGAKVRDESGAGQPSRTLQIDERTKAGAALARMLGDAASVTVQRGADRLNKDFVMLRRKTPWKVSPYSMRHQAAANMKATLGADAAQVVAAALGHRTTKSQHRYGSKGQAQAGGSAIRSVQATHQVKETRPNARPRPSGPGSAPAA